MLTNIQSNAIDEISFLRKDCKELIKEMFDLCASDENGNYPPAFRIVATPFLYAVWERCFRTCFSVMLKVIRTQTPVPAEMSFEQATLWLQKEGFLTSFIDKIRSKAPDNDEEPTKRALKASAYRNLAEFLGKLVDWHSTELQSTALDADLVMTFSNVNSAVLDANANAIGLASYEKYIQFRKRVGRLDDLVGRRNDISHGTLATPPGAREFNELSKLVSEDLIDGLCEVAESWIYFR